MNKDFIKYLANKLKTGNLRSIHLNALPGRYATRLDVTNLDILDQDDASRQDFTTSETFLFDYLLKKASFQFKISLEDLSLTNADEATIRAFAVVAKRLNSLQSENEDNYLEHGVQTFGFGFPLLVKRSKKDPTKIIKAPLLIWNLDIQRSHSQRNQWLIQKDEDSPIYLNEVLISHLSSDEDVVIQGISDAFLEDNLIDESELAILVRTVLAQLDTNPPDVNVRIQRSTDKDNVEKVTTHKPWIMWSGIFGLFRTQKQSIIRDIEKILEDFDHFDFENLTIEPFLQTTNSCVAVDPSQSEILTTLESNEYKVIQGPPGTGKSQSLTAIISNVLENDGKILVVCEKRTALEVIYNNLEKADLARMVAFIEDVNRDRKPIIDTVRSIFGIVRWVYDRFNEEEYADKLKSLTSLRKDFDARQSNLNGLVFRGLRFRDLIARYLRLKRTCANDYFSPVKFALTASEFELLEKVIQDAVDLFAEVNTDARVFDLIDAASFQEPYSTPLKNGIFEKLRGEFDFLRSFDFKKITIGPTNLKTNGLSLPAMNREFDIGAFQATRKLAKSNCLFWKNLLAKLSDADSFITSSSILGSNAVHRDLYSLRHLASDIARVQHYFQSLEGCLDEIAQKLKVIPAAQRELPLRFHWSIRFIRYFGKANRAKYEFWMTVHQRLTGLEDATDHNFFTSKTNIANFVSARESAPIDSSYLCEQIKKCIDKEDHFRDYYQWRRYKETLSDFPRKCITVLEASADLAKWLSNFQYAYYERLLEKLEIDIEHFNENDSKLKRIAALEEEVRSLQHHKILKAFGLKQFHAINLYNARGNINWLFNYRKNSQYARKNSLRSILHQEFDLFTQLFPVLLVTPTVASSILPLKQSAFDVVLFDEASQLRLEDTYPAVLRGKIKVISGDKHQMPPSSYFASDITLDSQDDDAEDNLPAQTHFDRTHPLFLAESESLLDFGNNNNPKLVNTSFLDFHYRSRHPFLIDFSNAAFYGSRLVPMPEKETYKPITLYQVDGSYQSNQTNPSEAEAIIKYIKESFPINEDGSYPSLGIATFNIQQRNLIKDRLYESSYSDAGFRKKLEMIGGTEEWFVKNLENIQGDERDVIILSTTFGLNSDGKFRQQFGPLNTAKGHRLLNVIVTRAKTHIAVFTSIPEHVYSTSYQDALPTSRNHGKAILYAYLDYCRAVSNDDEAKRMQILDLVEQCCDERGISHSEHLIESPFEQEVYDYLRDYIDPEKIIPQYKLGGFRVDFMVLDEDKNPKIAIECDGAQWHSGMHAYAYDLHRQRILENQGLEVCRIWSKTWFPDPEKEVKKLVKVIQRLEPSAIFTAAT